MHIQITTRDLSNMDEPPSVMIIDATVPFQQKWFAKHWWWAMCTNHTITMTPTTDPVTFVDRRTSAGEAKS
jgi:hypothetical protein